MNIMTRKAAKAAGLKRYFSGIACKEGHIAERQTSNNSCTECNRLKAPFRADYLKQWAMNNRDKTQEYQRRYDAKNAEKERARKQAYYDGNKAWHNERSKQYRIMNAAEVASCQARYRAANLNSILEYQRSHYERNRSVYIERARRREIGERMATPAWADMDAIKAIYQQAGAMRKAGNDVHVDHIVPLNGETVCGLHVGNNLRIIPANDNLSKHNRFDGDDALQHAHQNGAKVLLSYNIGGHLGPSEGVTAFG